MWWGYWGLESRGTWKGTSRWEGCSPCLPGYFYGPWGSTGHGSPGSGWGARLMGPRGQKGGPSPISGRVGVGGWCFPQRVCWVSFGTFVKKQKQWWEFGFDAATADSLEAPSNCPDSGIMLFFVFFPNFIFFYDMIGCYKSPWRIQLFEAKVEYSQYDKGIHPSGFYSW